MESVWLKPVVMYSEDDEKARRIGFIIVQKEIRILFSKEELFKMMINFWLGDWK